LDGAEQSEGCVEVAGVVAGGGSRGAGPFAADEGVVVLAVLGWLDGHAAAVAGAGVALGEAFALEHERKARALALYGATSGIAAVVGQLAGGLLVSAGIAGASWSPIFLVNVPVGLVVLLVASRIVPATRSGRTRSASTCPARCCSRPP